MREKLVQNRLFWQFNSASEVLVPNYAPGGWWENDVFRLTKAGFWHEYEIKTSMADFRKDFKKIANHMVTEVTDGHKITEWDDKHMLLARHQDPSGFVQPTRREELPENHWRRKYAHTYHDHRSIPQGPNHFWFVIPKGLQEKLEPLIPDYAGLMVATVRKEGTPQELVLQPQIVKKAPKLHGDKQFTDKAALWKKLGQTFYWRYWKQKDRI